MSAFEVLMPSKSVSIRSFSSVCFYMRMQCLPDCTRNTALKTI